MYTIMSVIHLLLSLLVNVTHLCLAEIGVPPNVVPYVVGVRRSCQGSQVYINCKAAAKEVQSTSQSPAFDLEEDQSLSSLL